MSCQHQDTRLYETHPPHKGDCTDGCKPRGRLCLVWRLFIQGEQEMAEEFDKLESMSMADFKSALNDIITGNHPEMSEPLMFHPEPTDPAKIKDEPYDPGCGRYASDIPGVVQFAEDAGLSPAAYVRREEGTYSSESNHFLCDMCYIQAGQPSSPSGWKCS